LVEKGKGGGPQGAGKKGSPKVNAVPGPPGVQRAPPAVSSHARAGYKPGEWGGRAPPEEMGCGRPAGGAGKVKKSFPEKSGQVPQERQACAMVKAGCWTVPPKKPVWGPRQPALGGLVGKASKPKPNIQGWKPRKLFPGGGPSPPLEQPIRGGGGW